MRTRRSDSRSTLLWTRQYHDSAGVPGGVTVFTDPNVPVRGELKSITDVSTVGYSNLRKNKSIVMNPYFVSKTTHSATGGTFKFRGWDGSSRTDIGELSLALPRPGNSEPGWLAARITDAKARTLQKAYSKMAGSEASVLVSVKEAGETLSMLRSPFDRSRKILEDFLFRRNRYASLGLALSKAAVSAWNEVRFGWKPVFKDIDDIHNAWLKTYERSIPRRRLVARDGEDVRWDTSFVETPLLAPMTDGVKWKGKAFGTVKVSSGVIYDLEENSLIETGNRNYGIRFRDIPVSLWQIVPYSFVVDRFLGVEQWINSIVPKPGVTVLGNWVSVVDTRTYDHTVVQWSANNAPAQSFQGDTFGDFGHSQTTVNISREVNQPQSIGIYSNPGVLSLTQQVDHFALVMARLYNLRVPKR